MRTLDESLEELKPLEQERTKLEAHIIVAGGEPPKMGKMEFSFCDPLPPGTVSFDAYKTAYAAHVEKLRAIVGSNAHIEKLRGAVANLKSSAAPSEQANQHSSEQTPKGAASTFGWPGKPIETKAPSKVNWTELASAANSAAAKK